MISISTLVFTYVLGAIFVIGGLVFMAFLDGNRLLFGIPYVLVGLGLLGGARGSQRRMRDRAAAEARAAAADASPEDRGA